LPAGRRAFQIMLAPKTVARRASGLSRLTSFAVVTATWLTETMMSPGWTPASAADLSGRTRAGA
jgi:hypothetical protein